MQPRTSVTIVASPRPRVGKTLLARMLLDFHAHEGRPAAGFDLNAGEATLAQFLPALATAASIGDVTGQMALFDRLIADDGTAKSVDLGHESFASFFAVAEQIGFAEEAARNGIAVTVLFLLTPDASSVEAFAALARRFPGVMLAPVHNEILGPAQHRGKYAQAGTLVRLPLLAAALRKYIGQAPFSFADADLALATDIPAEAVVELQHWRRRVHIEFRELGLRAILADLRGAIRIA